MYIIRGKDMKNIVGKGSIFFKIGDNNIPKFANLNFIIDNEEIDTDIDNTDELLNIYAVSYDENYNEINRHRLQIFNDSFTNYTDDDLFGIFENEEFNQLLNEFEKIV